MKLVAKVRRGTKLTPLEVMLQAMYEKVDAGDFAAAALFAEKCAGYIHPKLQAITQELSAEVNIGQVDAPVKEDREAWLAKRNAALTVISGAKAS